VTRLKGELISQKSGHRSISLPQSQRLPCFVDANIHVKSIKKKLSRALKKIDFNLKFMLSYKRTNEVDDLIFEGLASMDIRLRYCGTN